MADATLAPGSAPAPQGKDKPDRTIYAAGGGRKTVFSFIFLLLLPFYASLPAMIYMRLSHGLWYDTIGLGVLAVGFSVLMALIVIELLASLRTRVELGESSVKMTLPSGGGPTPLFSYTTREVPYDDIAAVETRREIYGGELAPVLLNGARLILKDGTSLRLGYVNESNTDPAFPYLHIAEQIAGRAGLEVIDRGSVRRSVRRKLLGLTKARLEHEKLPISDSDVVKLNKAHKRIVWGVIAQLVALVVIGVMSDFIFPPSTDATTASVSSKASAGKP